ncbi:MAG: hypothetical protein OEV49_04360 [candidate division Zixibacteria bacterium]|nr:hypothetical protein [candidate division Zixibacteria bacterium]MDH3936172.1 hypothetical protein [candidate division Zixibacteria bacterium]MDH4033377.1 hypothetical protein [candidate division Zixibacteria bacterium]
MEKHVQVLGILFIVFGIMGLIAAVAVFAIFGLGGALAPSDEEVLLLVTIGTFIAAMVAVTSVPGILAGWGLLKHQNWARILALVLSFLNLPGIPFGTALGIYGIFVLFNDETVRLFEGRSTTPTA